MFHKESDVTFVRNQQDKYNVKYMVATDVHLDSYDEILIVESLHIALLAPNNFSSAINIVAECAVKTECMAVNETSHWCLIQLP